MDCPSRDVPKLARKSLDLSFGSKMSAAQELISIFTSIHRLTCVGLYVTLWCHHTSWDRATELMRAGENHPQPDNMQGDLGLLVPESTAQLSPGDPESTVTCGEISSQEEAASWTEPNPSEESSSVSCVLEGPARDPGAAACVRRHLGKDPTGEVAPRSDSELGHILTRFQWE